MAGPALIAFGIDHALPALRSGDNLPLVFTGVAYLLAAIATAGLTALYVTSTARLSQAMLLDLRVRVFRHTQRLSLEFHEKYTSGRIIARQTSDLEALRELLDSGVSSLASGFLFMAFTAATIFALDWRSGLLVLAAGVPMFFLARWYQKHSQIAFRESRVVSARLIVHFVETMTGIRAVKAFRKEKENSETYGDLAEDYRLVTVRSINLNGIFQPGLVLIGNVCVAVVLLFGGFRVLGGDLAVGVLLALILSTKRFFQPVDQMAMFYNSFQSAQAALEKVSGLLEEVPTVRPPKNPVPLPEATRAHRLQGRGIPLRGRAVGSAAPEPAHPRGTDRCPGGTDRCRQVHLGQAHRPFLRRHLGNPHPGRRGPPQPGHHRPAPEHRHGHPGSLPVQRFGGGQHRTGPAGGITRRDRGGRKGRGAHAFILELPEGYDTDVNKRGGRVSSGQRQLISFARAFLARPAVLILDEATSSLDIPSERLVQAGLARLLAGTEAARRTALIIAHRLSTVETADRVLVVHDGRIVEDGTPEELIGGGGRFADLHGAWKDSLV